MTEEKNLQFPNISVNGLKLIKETFLVYKRYFIPISIIVLIVAIPVEIFKNYYSVPLEYDESVLSSIKRDGLFTTFFLSLITPTIIIFLFQRLLGNQITIFKSFLFGLKTWPKIIGYGIAKNIIIIIGFICFIIPGIILIFRLFFLYIIISIEGVKENEPIRVSFQMTRGNVWQLILYNALMTVAIVLPVFIFIFLIEWFFEGWIANTLIDLVVDLFFVLYTVMALLLYIVLKNQARNMKVDAE